MLGVSVTVRAGSLPRASADALLPGTDGPLVSDVTGADGGLIGAGAGCTITTGGGSVGAGVVVVVGGADGAAGAVDCANAARDAKDSAKTRAIDEVRKGAPPR